MNEKQMPPGISKSEILRILDPAISVAERQSSWRKKPLSVQARKVQDNWKPAFKGPLQLGLAASALAFVALPVMLYSDTWRLAGLTVFLLWYPTMLWSGYQMHRLSKLRVKEI
ncbi:MAG: hypothetical protein ABJD06_13370 [Hyphomicrobiales bacterium]